VLYLLLEKLKVLDDWEIAWTQNLVKGRDGGLTCPLALDIKSQLMDCIESYKT
jgi:hypothetical protein